RMEKMASKIRNAREVAEIWTKQFGEAPQSDIGKIVMEMVKNIAFETSIRLGEQEGGIEPKDLALLSSALQRLEQAESLSYERERKIRKEVIEQAAKAVEESGTQAGLSLEDVTKMVKAVYGIE
ncbi:DUF3486 family protein, partial [Glaesserella parasuis]|nr:DUF3486 family protein [Glaesserella parasuis]